MSREEREFDVTTDGGLAQPVPAGAAIATGRPDERGLLRLMKAWRGGRATTNIMAVLADSYVTLLTLAVLGAMIVNLILETQHNISRCDTVGCLSARALLPGALCAGVLSAALALSLMFGPVLASAAEGFWLFDAPLRRSRILGRRLLGIVAASGVVGAALGALVATLTGSAGLGIIAWALAAGLGAAGVVAFAAAEQGAERTALVRIAQAVTALACVVALALVVAIARGLLPWHPDATRGTLVAFGVAGVGAVLLVVSIVVAFGRLNTMRRARLTSGGALVSGMQGAAYALDLGLLRDILVERKMRQKGWVRPTLGRGTGASALMWRDVQRVLRDPKPTVGVLISALVPYAVSALGLAPLAPPISAIVLFIMLVPTMNSLRVLTRTPGLARMFPMSTAQIRSAAMRVPAIVAGVWALLVLPAFLGVTGQGVRRDPLQALLYAVATALAGLLGAVRWTTVKQVNFNTPMMSVGAAAMPPSLMFNLFRGFDMAALVTAPLVFNLNPMWSLGLALVVYLALRGTFDMDELQAAKERQERLAAEEKAKMEAKRREKIKVQRGR